MASSREPIIHGTRAWFGSDRMNSCGQASETGLHIAALLLFLSVRRVKLFAELAACPARDPLPKTDCAWVATLHAEMEE
jgi:hypothetical protein